MCICKIKAGGNPAGIVLNADLLSQKVKQQIAKKVGLSETAFAQKSNDADFKVEFFTPNEEVDLCGHATIALFHLLAKKNMLKPGKYTQETKAGILNIEIKKNHTIFMNQNLPQFFNEINKKEIAESLNIPEKMILDELPIQIVSTGLRDIIVPIKSQKDLIKIQPNFIKVSRISKKYNVIGYHLFSLETKFSSTAYCRNLAPLYGIPEESATGTSNGALSCYLYHYGKITKKQAVNLVFEQGYSLGKPSEILVNLQIKNDTIKEVKVGGIGSNIKEIHINI